MIRCITTELAKQERVNERLQNTSGGNLFTAEDLFIHEVPNSLLIRQNLKRGNLITFLLVEFLFSRNLARLYPFLLESGNWFQEPETK